MQFNPVSFLLGRFLLTSQGIDTNRANQLSFITSFLPPDQGMVIAFVIGQREAPTPIVMPSPIKEKEKPPVIKEDDKEAKQGLLVIPSVIRQREAPTPFVMLPTVIVTEISPDIKEVIKEAKDIHLDEEFRVYQPKRKRCFRK